MHEKIKIDYIAKIEGHASFLADIVKGEIEKARVKVEEGARLIEGILRNRRVAELPEVSSRICGVCPIVHYLTSLKAIEDALGVGISEQTSLLRKLMMASQIITSHSLHLFFFSSADFFAIESNIDLVKKFPSETSWAIKLRDAGNKIAKTIGGRSVHPLTPTIGGFRKLPQKEDLLEISKTCAEALDEAENFANFFVKMEYPEFERKTEYISLIDNIHYTICDGKLMGHTVSDFLKVIREIEVPGDAEKRTTLEQPYMVGALPRIINNNAYLNPLAKKIFLESGIQNHYYNPFYNILAQAIEVVHFLEEAIMLTNILLARGIIKEENKFQLSPGKGIGAMEAPRGTLFYEVEIDNKGIISDLNIITPTVQNLANLEKDLEEFENLKGWKELSASERKQKIAMLIRAYDPCITCATH